MITDKLLQQIDTRAPAGGAWAAALAVACDEFGIRSPREVAAFLAQCAAESAGFSRVEENLHYSRSERLAAVFPSRFRTAKEAEAYIGQPARIANLVYAGKNGNGPAASGDGWRYRGRGLIQITGRANYTACLADLYGAADIDPDRLLEPDGAARSAAWYWWHSGCGQALTAKGFDATTRLINGPAMLGRDERRALFARACAALGVQP